MIFHQFQVMCQQCYFRACIQLVLIIEGDENLRNLIKEIQAENREIRLLLQHLEKRNPRKKNKHGFNSPLEKHEQLSFFDQPYSNKMWYKYNSPPGTK